MLFILICESHIDQLKCCLYQFVSLIMMRAMLLIKSHSSRFLKPTSPDVKSLVQGNRNALITSLTLLPLSLATHKHKFVLVIVSSNKDRNSSQLTFE